MLEGDLGVGVPRLAGLSEPGGRKGEPGARGGRPDLYRGVMAPTSQGRAGRGGHIAKALMEGLAT